MRWEPFQFVNVSATEYDVFGLECSEESLDDIFNKTPPLFPAMLL
jgi:hypothetical protein